jgi:hypothetical protein
VLRTQDGGRGGGGSLRVSDGGGREPLSCEKKTQYPDTGGDRPC